MPPIDRTGSVDFLPGVSLALLPSSFLAAHALAEGPVAGVGLIRLLLVIVAATALLSIGAYRRLTALVYPSLWEGVKHHKTLRDKFTYAIAPPGT